MSLLAIRLPDKLSDRVEKITKELQRTKSFIVRKALERYLDDYIDYQIALDRLNDQDDEIITSDEMDEELRA